MFTKKLSMAVRMFPSCISAVLALTAASTAVTLSSVPVARARVEYSVTGLGFLPTFNYDPYSTCGGINGNSEVVGTSIAYTDVYAVGNGFYPQAFLYSGGTMIDLGTGGVSYGGTDGTTHAYGINESGQVAGGAYTVSYTATPPYTASGSYHAFLYSDGSMTDLGTLGGNSSVAYGINDSGQVVGWATTASGVGHAFLYSGGTMTNLGTLGGNSSVAYGINDSGQVVGKAETTSGSYHAFLYSDGSVTDLGTLGGNQSFAHGVNDGGQVVGGADTASGENLAFLYSGGTMTILGTLGGNGSYASGINDSGQVVGWAATASGDQHAFLYSGSTMSDLNSLIPADSGWTLTNASGINDFGDIAGTGTDPSGHTEAFLLTPSTPEPPSLAMLAIAGFGMLFWRRRHRMGAG